MTDDVTCPCCKGGSAREYAPVYSNKGIPSHFCTFCGCKWDNSMRRAEQPTAAAVDERAILGALKSTLDAHGPITLHNYGSACKRILGGLRASCTAQPERRGK